MVDGDEETVASTVDDGDVELCDTNTCPGTNLGKITKVELRAWGSVSDGGNVVYLRPVFVAGDGDNHNSGIDMVEGWASWIDITSDTNAPSPWTWAAVQALDCDVEFSKNVSGASVSKVEIRVTYDVYFSSSSSSESSSSSSKSSSSSSSKSSSSSSSKSSSSSSSSKSSSSSSSSESSSSSSEVKLSSSSSSKSSSSSSGAEGESFVWEDTESFVWEDTESFAWEDT